MIRSLILTYWELRRLKRSKRALLAMLIIPVLGILACMWFRGEQYIPFRCMFPAAAFVSSWLILYVRSYSDRASGFTAGVDSSPAEGAIAFASRIMTGLTLVLVQSVLFFTVVLLLLKSHQ